MTPQAEAIRLLEEALKELESSKGSVSTGVTKLSRAASLLGEFDIHVWCAIQQGDQTYSDPLKDLIAAYTTKDEEERKDALKKALARVDSLKLKSEIHYPAEDLALKLDDAGGGFSGIGFIEERYVDLVRLKKGNDKTHYKQNLHSHIIYVRRLATDLASTLLNKLKFAGTVRNSFDTLKAAVDDKLLDLNPALAEQLMLAFKSVSSQKDEEWSHALTTARRLIEGVADVLFPATSETFNGRSLSQPNYINRLWAFMDRAIESDSNKELAKAHVDFLGVWMEKTTKLAHKGVHAGVSQIEAVKAIFHLYLVLADLLDYMHRDTRSTLKKDINAASIDELEALLNISRATAKEIVKARILVGTLNKDILKGIKGVGPKALAAAAEVYLI